MAKRRWAARAEREHDEDQSEAPAAQTDMEALRAMRKESRAVLDHQISLAGDIDDKAMHTVRTAVLTLGLVLSAISLASPGTIATAPFWSVASGALGIICLLLTLILGIGTYASSWLRFGVAPDHRSDVIAGGYEEREWLFFLFSEYDEWIGYMRDWNDVNDSGLTWTLLLLLASLFSFVLSVTLFAFAR